MLKEHSTFKILRVITQLITSKEYGVGDPTPTGVKYCELDSLDVHRSKLLIQLIVELTPKKPLIKGTSHEIGTCPQ